MKESGVLNLKVIMVSINLLAVVFILILLRYTTWLICENIGARDFLNGIHAIPLNSMTLYASCLLLLICLLLSFFLRESRFKGNNTFALWSLVFDFAVSMALVVLLDFNYNGILLWVFANVIEYVSERVKPLFMAAALFLYMFTNHELIMISPGLFSLGDYIAYYNSDASMILTGIFNLLGSLNIVFFILFCVFVIQERNGIIKRVNLLYAQLGQKNTELEHANRDLKNLADIREQMGKTEERNRLAREIHDTLGHTLTGISAGLDACITIFDSDPEAVKNQLSVISKVTRDGISEVRKSVSELRPDSVRSLSLEQSIRDMIEDVRLVTKAEINLSITTVLKFEEDEENTIYRIVQESITNSIRHGKASRIDVDIYREESKLHIRIHDDGVGCKELKKGFGTRHMIERVRMLNGKVSFDGENGFTVYAVLPIRWGEDHD